MESGYLPCVSYCYDAGLRVPSSVVAFQIQKQAMAPCKTNAPMS